MSAARRRFPLLRLLSDQRGTSVIELSFIAPLLIILACGATDLAMCYARQLSLQQSAARTAEFALASGVKTGLAATLQTEAAAAAGGSATTTVDTWLECDGVRQANYDGSCTGAPSRFISVTITETYNWMFEQLVPSWNSQPYSVQLKGYAEVRIQ